MVKIKDNRAGSKRDARDMNKPELSIGCAACLRLFASHEQMTQHVSSTHGAENLVSLFFNNTDEFTKWKREVERTVIVKYLHDDAATVGHALYDNAANIYSCNARTSPKATPMKTPLPGVSKYFCPSIMIVQWYTTAVHVLYYRAHYGHSCPMYTLPDRYNNNITSNLIYTQWHNKFLESPDISVLTKFNILMNAIANGAEVISEENLRMLHGKAIEFMLDMKRPRQDKIDKGPKQDRQENLRAYVGQKVKKTAHLEEELLTMNKSRFVKPLVKMQEKAPEKKQTVLMPKPLKSVHAFCLNDIESELKEEWDDNPLDTDVDIPEIKEENDLEIEEHDLEEIAFKKAAPKAHSPKIKKLKPQKPTETPKKVPKAPPEVQKEPPIEPMKPWINNSPSSFNDTYKTFLEQTIQTPFKEELGKRKKHEPPSLLKQRKFKTKLGFAPLPQTKKVLRKREKRPVTKSPSSSSGSEEVKVKVEEYEVMEQENDCNILILKF